jgi:hypothetical protein
MAELFQVGVGTINHHLKELYDELEIDPAATIRRHRIVRSEGSRQVARQIEHYSLPAVLAVGYRVRSHRGTQFRQWATIRLGEYLVKGFTLDDERLKNPPGKGHTDYFDELLERIRDIRSSERRFYQKVLDIYATSVDYTPSTEQSQEFFATVQNKMHWATHGHTAAELVYLRADSAKPLMGMKSTRPGGIIRKEDVAIAKNYLSEEELHALNRIVNAYLEFAEVQALNRRPMAMRDWAVKLDDFLKLAGRELLDHAGKVSAEAAKLKAEQEFERYRGLVDAMPRQVDAEFDKLAERSKKLKSKVPPKPAQRHEREGE